MAGIASGIVNLALLLPTLAVCVRRLHDIGRSGWWLLLMLTIIGNIPVIYWLTRDSMQEDNEYGAFVAAPPS